MVRKGTRSAVSVAMAVSALTIQLNPTSHGPGGDADPAWDVRFAAAAIRDPAERDRVLKTCFRASRLHRVCCVPTMAAQTARAHSPARSDVMAATVLLSRVLFALNAQTFSDPAVAGVVVPRIREMRQDLHDALSAPGEATATTALAAAILRDFARPEA